MCIQFSWGQKWCLLCLLHPILNTLSGGPCPGQYQSLGPVCGLTDNASLSFSLWPGATRKWHKALIPLSTATLGQPTFEQKKKKKQLQRYRELQRVSDEGNDHLLAFGMGHMDFLFSIFVIFICHENICPCSEPSPEDNQWPEGNH